MWSIPVLNGFVHIEPTTLPFACRHPQIQQEPGGMHGVRVGSRFRCPDVQLVGIPRCDARRVNQCRKLHTQSEKCVVTLFHIPDDLHVDLNFDSNFITLLMPPITSFIKHKVKLKFLSKTIGNLAGLLAGVIAC